MLLSIFILSRIIILECKIDLQFDLQNHFKKNLNITFQNNRYQDTQIPIRSE